MSSLTPRPRKPSQSNTLLLVDSPHADVFGLKPVGQYDLYFGTDKSPLIMDKEMNVIAKLGPVLNGTFKNKEAGK